MLRRWLPLLALAVLLPVAGAADDYTLGPDSQPRDGVQIGRAHV